MQMLGNGRKGASETQGITSDITQMLTHLLKDS
jgi:hypothetical protein